MNRREFIKSAGVAAALPAIAITCKYEDDEKGEKEALWKRWDYVVYCYERGQGEWTFNTNIRGSFAPEREYMTLEDEAATAYCGWMDGGKLHFSSLDDAENFVDCHVRTKDDTNLIDSIYDVYYIKRETKTYADAAEITERELHVAHYWFNGDTGRQINWVAEKPYTDWSKVECS